MEGLSYTPLKITEDMLKKILVHQSPSQAGRPRPR